MSGIAQSLVRRAVGATHEYYNLPYGQDGDQIKKIAMGGIVLLWATGLLYVAVLSVISYTCRDVIATLTMIETPTATAFQLDSADEVNAPLHDQKTDGTKAVEADLFLVKQKPITSKIRTALKHIKAQGGRGAAFRGLHVALIYIFASSVITNLFTSFTGIYRPIVSIFTAVLLCRLQMTWTHVVISKPSERHWFRRFPSVKAGKNIILPTAVLAIAKQAAVYVPTAMFGVATQTWQRPGDNGQDETQKKLALLQMLLIGLTGIATVVLVVIPANVTLKRVQASMLPEEDEAIVPFDRTFAGKVKPEILGGSGAVGMLDAWRTFDRSARFRLLKLYVKILAVQVATTILFLMVVVAELKLIMGDDFGKVVKMAHEFRGQVQQ